MSWDLLLSWNFSFWDTVILVAVCIVVFGLGAGILVLWYDSRINSAIEFVGIDPSRADAHTEVLDRIPKAVQVLVARGKWILEQRRHKGMYPDLAALLILQLDACVEHTVLDQRGIVHIPLTKMKGIRLPRSNIEEAYGRQWEQFRRDWQKLIKSLALLFSLESVEEVAEDGLD